MTSTLSMPRSGLGRSAWLAAGLASAVLVRAGVTRIPGGQDGDAAAFGSGLAFGMALLALAILGGWSMRWPTVRAVGLGLGGGLALVLLPVIARPQAALVIGIRPEPFALWVAVTAIVAVGEEAILRGVLFDAVRSVAGPPVAVVGTSLAFALLHVPLYGWHVVPLDLAVGVWLAGLRLVSGGVAAPAVAHALADLATWWL